MTYRKFSFYINLVAKTRRNNDKCFILISDRGFFYLLYCYYLFYFINNQVGLISVILLLICFFYIWLATYIRLNIKVQPCPKGEGGHQHLCLRGVGASQPDLSKGGWMGPHKREGSFKFIFFRKSRKKTRAP